VGEFGNTLRKRRDVLRSRSFFFAAKKKDFEEQQENLFSLLDALISDQ